jgi:ABC-type polysaccharide/polyol phosphate transport system ATPase subunit
VTLRPGSVALREVSRSFRLLHERNLTLKETVLRRRRTVATELWALREVTLDVAPGEAVGLIGRNGSGKSTLLKVVAGIIPPHEGEVRTAGRVASMLELGAGFHPDFTGRENVFMNGAILGLSEAEVADRLDVIVSFAEISDFVDMPVKTYSSGMYMRLAFAIASHVEPDVLLLDEVLAVGDEAFQRKCMGRMFDYRRRGGTLLFVSHDANSVELICDRAVLLDDGRVVQDGPPAAVLAEYHRRLAGPRRAGIHASTEESAPPADALPPADDSRQWGNRRVLIESCRLVGRDGPTDRFMSGDPLTLEISLRSSAPVTAPIIGLTLHTVEGMLCFGTHTGLDGRTLGVIDGSARVSFAVERLHLHEGRFCFTLAVSADGEMCHWLERWLEFTVFQRTAGVGPVDVAGDWAFEAANAAEPTTAGHAAA